MCSVKPEIDARLNDVSSAILYGFVKRGREYCLDELSFLAESAGVTVLEELAQRTTTPSPRYYINPGSVKALTEIVQLAQPDIVIFDCELKGSQRNNLEDELDVPVIDRTELILDIFASRANTREGKLQVELAQLMYQLPRLMGMGKHLSALGGGIGTRGPGETKLELDRRRINQRIAFLKKEIRTLERHRRTQRKSRTRSKIPKVALVGYTNAGKSTLINALTGSDAYSDNRLFATLDPLTRRGFLPGSRQNFLITDTVGFIRDIPTQLIAAFKATLEEIKFADLLLIIVDVVDDDHEEKLQVVRETLEEIGAADLDNLIVYNKTDLLENSEIPLTGDGVAISAKSGEGLDELLQRIDSLISTDGADVFQNSES